MTQDFAEEVKAYRDTYECGLVEARAAVLKKYRDERLEQARYELGLFHSLGRDKLIDAIVTLINLALEDPL